MTGEHSPRPGVTWQQRSTTREIVVPDGPWGGPATVRLWGSAPVPSMPPRLNRADRRAVKRAKRKPGRGHVA